MCHLSFDKTEKTKNHGETTGRQATGWCFADVTWAARVDIKRPRVSARVLAFRLCNVTLSALATRSIACIHDTLNNFLSPARDIAFRPPPRQRTARRKSKAASVASVNNFSCTR